MFDIFKNSKIIGLTIILILFAGVILAIIPMLSTVQFIDIKEIIFNKYTLKIIRFSFYQAFLSALLSVIPAIFIARAFIRQRFKFKKSIIKLLALATITPSIIAVFAIIDIFGNNGFINQTLVYLGFSGFKFYGLTGILITHTFFNLSLSTLLLILAYNNIPSNFYKTAQQLQLTSWNIFLFIDLKLIKKEMLYIFILVFLLCFGSFTVILTVGGGAKSTTLELAIYQAIKFNFQPEKAAIFALIQILIFTSLSFIIIKNTSKNISLTNKLTISVIRFDNKRQQKLFDYILIICITIFISLPFISILLGLFNSSFIKVLTNSIFHKAILKSILIAIASSGWTMIATLFICSYIITIKKDKTKNIIQIFTLLGFIIPSIILGTGWFLLTYKYFDVSENSMFLIIFIHFFISLPFSIRLLLPQIQTSYNKTRKLAKMLNLSEFNYFKIIIWREIAPAFAKASSIVFCLSLGDLGAATLFANSKTPTLSLYLYDLLSSYKIEQAGVVSAVFIIICIISIVIINGFINKVINKATNKTTNANKI